MKNYKETKCLICDKLFMARGSVHYYCDSCNIIKTKEMDTIELTTVKRTWKNTKPNTISRSQLIRRNKKQTCK